LAFIPRDPLILAAERERRTVVEFAPESASALAFVRLSETVLGIDPDAVPLPTPLSDDAFFEFIRS
ncbi:MAG TPA: hypothetical protein PLI95_15530, partial [Polyangiaceae bacterium]|nr:hypothetical protein [Polyangiaceae bacterium]